MLLIKDESEIEFSFCIEWRNLVDCENEDAPTMAELSTAFSKFDDETKSKLDETIKELSKIKEAPLAVDDFKNRERLLTCIGGR